MGAARRARTRVSSRRLSWERRATASDHATGSSHSANTGLASQRCTRSPTLTLAVGFLGDAVLVLWLLSGGYRRLQGISQDAAGLWLPRLGASGRSRYGRLLRPATSVSPPKLTSDYVTTVTPPLPPAP